MPSPIRPTNLLLGAIAIACGTYAYLAHADLVKVRNDLDSMRHERDSLHSRIAELEKSAKASAANLAAATAQAANAQAFPRPRRFGGEPGGPMPFRGGGMGGPMAFGAFMDNPEVQKLLSIQQKAGLDSRYAALFKQLNLSPADLDKFKNLLVEKQATVRDAVTAARAQGVSTGDNRDALRQVITNAQDEVDDNIKTVLGDDAYSQYQTYEQTQPERNLVTQLQQRLSYSATPLTDDQANQVIAIMAANAPQPSSNSGGTGGGFGPLGGGRNGGPPITDAVVAAAQGVLNDTQVAALTQLQQEQQAQAALVAQMRAARQAAATSTANTAATGAQPSGPLRP
jgi:hypothetical protein